MANETARILIHTVVKKALRDFPDAPERVIRNLVDMALIFASGPFQQTFFQAAQTMLQNGQSPYYSLFRDVVAHVEHEKLLGFGVALGYNSCTAGAASIREREEREFYHIPWTMTLTLGAGMEPELCEKTVSQGETLGIHTWRILPKGQPQAGTMLALRHPESAFVLMCRPGDVTPALVDSASEANNLMLVVRAEAGAPEACEALREAGLLYSISFSYGDENREAVLNGDVFIGAEQLHPAFTILLAEPGCSSETREAVHSYAASARKEQLFKTLPWDFYGDDSLVDSIISREPLSAGFDGTGQLWVFEERREGADFNLHERSLPEILKRAFPMKEAEQ